MDDFANYDSNKNFWWMMYLTYGDMISHDPSFSVQNGFELGKYFKTKDGKLIKAKIERIAYGEVSQP